MRPKRALRDRGLSGLRPGLLLALVLLFESSAAPPLAVPNGSVHSPFPINLGQTLTGHLPEGEPYEAEVAFRFMSPVSGTITIDARSLDFDTFLIVSRMEPEGGSTILRMDDDTGVATNSRAILDVSSGARYLIRVQSQELLLCGDEFDLGISPGGTPSEFQTAEAGDRYHEAPSGYYEEVASRARSVGSPACKIRALLAESLGASPAMVWAQDVVAAREVLGKIPRARAESAVEIAESSLEPGRPARVAALLRLGSILWQLKDYDGALERLDQALRETETRNGKDHISTAGIHFEISVAYAWKGDEPARQEYLRRRREILLETLGPEHLVYIDARSFGQASYMNALAAEARAGALDDVSRVEALRGPSHPDLSDRLHYLYMVHGGRGEFSEAVSTEERAYKILEDVFGPNHHWVLGRLNALAIAVGWIGDLERLIPLRRELLRRSILIGKSTLTAKANLMGNLLSLGEVAEAESLFEEVQDETRTLALDETQPSGILYLQSDMHLARGEYEEAAASLERAIEIDAAGGVADETELWESRAALGGVYAKQGKLDLARKTLENAWELLQKVLANSDLDEIPFEVGLHTELGKVLLELGEPDKARWHLDRALRIQDSAMRGTADGFAAPEGAFQLARLDASQGRVEEALDRALQSERISRSRLRLLARGLPERLALSYSSVSAPAQDLALTVLRGHEGNKARFVERVWGEVVRSRGAVLDETASRTRLLHGSGDSETSDLLHRLMHARSRQAHIALQAQAPDGNPDTYRALVSEVTSQVEELEQALLARTSVLTHQKRSETIGFEEVREALPSGSALVAYVRYEKVPVPAGPGRSPAATSSRPEPVHRYAAFVLNRSRPDPRVFFLGPSDTVDAAVKTWRRQVTALEPGGRESKVDGGSRAAGARLEKLIWDPLAGALEGADRVFIVPDGALNLVSFAALPDGDGGYLVESGPLLHYLSAERDLIPSSHGTASPTLLALGGPDFDDSGAFAALRKTDPGQPAIAADAGPESERTAPAGTVAAARVVHAPVMGVTAPGAFRGERSACGDMKDVSFEPLVEAAREVRDLADLWKARSAKGAEPPVLVLTGSSATETAFKERAADTHILHLATHGFFLGGECASALTLRRGLGAIVVSGDAIPPPAGGENPLLLSGLALAGANNREHAGPGEDDGILTAQEIAAMDLGGVEWAVLSACDTGVGEVRAGEGVFGLRRAFQTAGVKTLVMSLWSVEDEATRQWMKALYEGRLEEGMNTAEAVRHASLQVLGDRRKLGLSDDPFYWAAFVAAGDWK